jgi:hypothetical protein
VVQFGWIEFRDCSELLALADRTVLTCDRSTDGAIRVSGLFHNQAGSLVARIEDNEWWVSGNQAWDVEFVSASRLVVRAGPGDIVLRMKVTDRSLQIQQCFFRHRDLSLDLRGDDRKSLLEIHATNTFFRSENEQVIVRGPMKGPAIRLV